MGARAAREDRRRRAWAALHGSVGDRLAIVTDPCASREELTTIAPALYERDPDPELVAAVLAHPQVPAGVVSRYATVSDPQLRLAVAEHPLCPTSTLLILERDHDPRIAALAARRLRALAIADGDRGAGLDPVEGAGGDL